jgi:hypothetical protein
MLSWVKDLNIKEVESEIPVNIVVKEELWIEVKGKVVVNKCHQTLRVHQQCNQGKRDADLESHAAVTLYTRLHNSAV